MLFRLRAALPSRLRELNDLVVALERMLSGSSSSPREPDDRTERVLLYLWKRTIVEEGLHPTAQQALEKILKIEDVPRIAELPSLRSQAPASPKSARERMVLIASDKLRLAWAYRELKRFQTSNLGMSVALRSRVRTLVEFWPDGVDPSRGIAAMSSPLEREPPVQLSNRTVAMLKLVTDVVATRATPLSVSSDVIPGESGFVGGSLLAPKEFEGAFVRVNYHSSELDRNLRFVWRVPRWDAFLDFDLFQQLWEYYAHLPGRPEQLARVFAILAVAVSRREDVDHVVNVLGHGPATLPDLVDEPRVDKAWRIVQRAAFEDEPKWWSGRRATAFTTWRKAVLPAFAAPEAGLQRGEATLILNAMMEAPHIPERREYFASIAFERRRHLRAVTAVAMGRERGEVKDTDVRALERELGTLDFELSDELAGPSQQVKGRSDHPWAG
jgi:hypothetical protein